MTGVQTCALPIYLHEQKQALKDLDMATQEGTTNPADAATRNLTIAEINLEAGDARKAQEAATSAAAQFKSAGQLDSELHSACIGAAAAKLNQDAVAFSHFSTEVIDIVTRIQQTWTPQDSQSYLSRPDLQIWMRQNHLGPALDRR